MERKRPWIRPVHAADRRAYTVRRTVGASTPLQLSINQDYAMGTHFFRSPFNSSYAHPQACFASSNKCACIDRSPIPS
jgi:hypothetical protein